MRLPLSLAVALCAAAPAVAVEFGPCARETTAPAAVATALDAVLLGAVDPESGAAAAFGHAPGGVLAVTAPDWGHVRSAGASDPETGAPLDCASPFEIGGNTKMMAAAVLLQLVEEGALGLDDPLSRHLPEIAAGLPHGAAMTLRHLARHTSGVFSYTDDAPDGAPGVMEGAVGDPDALRRGYAAEAFVAFALDHGAPSFAPGEGWAYSNTGYVLLGMVIERTAGAPLAALFERRIFARLGMADTRLWNGVPTPALGLPSAWPAAPFDVETTDWNLSQGWAAGGVVSTAEDMRRLMEGLLAGRLFQRPGTLAVARDGALSIYGALGEANAALRFEPAP